MKDKKCIYIDTMVRQSEEIDATDLNDEKVMMNLNRGQYYALNQVGSRIWDMIREPLAIKDIIAILLNEYEIDAPACEAAVIDFLGRMKDAELICIY